MMTERITSRPWKGPCAVTRLTMEEYDERLKHVAHLPAWATRAAVDICRAYGIKGECDPAYIANVIHGNAEGVAR